MGSYVITRCAPKCLGSYVMITRCAPKCLGSYVMITRCAPKCYMEWARISLVCAPRNVAWRVIWNGLVYNHQLRPRWACMLPEFMAPLVTLCCVAIVGIASLDRLCQFHQAYQTVAAKLESERWLVEQCEDPHFFSKMHLHSDLCFVVENNARVGAFMLALREFTQSFLDGPYFFSGFLSHQGLLSWPVLCGGGLLLLLGPSWFVSTSRRSFQKQRWPQCIDYGDA
jgi:hypothetical protein